MSPQLMDRGRNPDGWARMALPKLVTLGKPPELHGHSPDASWEEFGKEGCGRKQMAPTTFSSRSPCVILSFDSADVIISAPRMRNLPQISKLFQRINIYTYISKCFTSGNLFFVYISPVLKRRMSITNSDFSLWEILNRMYLFVYTYVPRDLSFYITWNFFPFQTPSKCF